ncbi:hypothetical protein LSM04_000853 [Trypanosoma melophagium]|uniref:uncharacterized protein n=1 Tax=Trypanosoma melophagium TaxID=715481 RepID=UPI00351A88F6|nr:hypothetical protein LSM04_000853 [Trypanosoma melophagium]
MSNASGHPHTSSNNTFIEDGVNENSTVTPPLHDKQQEKTSMSPMYPANTPSSIPNVNTSSNYNENDVIINQEGTEENSTPRVQSCDSGASPSHTPLEFTPIPHAIMGADRYQQDISQDLFTTPSATQLMQAHGTNPIVASQRGLSSITDMPDETVLGMLEENERRSREAIMANEHENQTHYVRSHYQLLILKQERLARQGIEKDYGTQLHMLYDAMVDEEDFLLEDEIREIGLQELREEEEKEREREAREGMNGMKVNFFTRSGDSPPFHEGTEDSDEEEMVVNSAHSHIDPNSSNSFTNRKPIDMSPINESYTDDDIHPDDDPAVVLAKLQRKYKPLMPRYAVEKTPSQVSDVKPSNKTESKGDSGSESTSTEDNTPLETEVIAEGGKRRVGKTKKGDQPTWEEEGAERQELPVEMESPMKPETLDGHSKRDNMKPSSSTHPVHEEYQLETDDDEPDETPLESDNAKRLPKRSQYERQEELERQLSSPSQESEKDDVSEPKHVGTTSIKVDYTQRDAKLNAMRVTQSTTTVNEEKNPLSDNEVIRSDIPFSSDDDDDDDSTSPLQAHLGGKHNIYSAQRSREIDKEAMEHRPEVEDEEDMERPFDYSLSSPKEKSVPGSKRRSRGDDVASEQRPSDEGSVDQDGTPLNTSVMCQGGKAGNNPLPPSKPFAETQGFSESSELDDEAALQPSTIPSVTKPRSNEQPTDNPSVEMEQSGNSLPFDRDQDSFPHVVPVPSGDDASSDEETEEEPLPFYVIYEGGKSTIGAVNGEPPAEHTSYRSSDSGDDSGSSTSNPFDTPMPVEIIHKNITRTRNVPSRGSIEASESCSYVEEHQEDIMDRPLQPELLFGNGIREPQPGNTNERSAAFEERSESPEDEEQEDKSILPNLGNRPKRGTPHIPSKRGPFAESTMREGSGTPSDDENPMDSHLVYSPSVDRRKARGAASPVAMATGSSSESLEQESDGLPLESVTMQPKKRLDPEAPRHHELVHSVEESEKEDDSEEEDPLESGFSPRARGSGHAPRYATPIVEETMIGETDEEQEADGPLEINIAEKAPNYRYSSPKRETEESWLQGSSNDSTDIEEDPIPTQVGKVFPRHGKSPPRKNVITAESYGSQLSTDSENSQLGVVMGCIRPDKRENPSGDLEYEWEADTKPSFHLHTRKEVVLLPRDIVQDSEKQVILAQEEDPQQDTTCVRIEPKQISPSAVQQPTPTASQTVEEKNIEPSIQKTKTIELQSFELHEPTEKECTLQDNCKPESPNYIQQGEGIIQGTESEVPVRLAGLHEDGEGAYPAEAKEPGEHEMDNVEPDETAPQATTLREEEVPTEVPEVADTQEQEIAPRDVRDADAVEAFMSTDEVHPPDMKGPEEREMSGVEPDDVSTKVTGLHEDGEGAYPAEAKKPGEHEMDNVEPDETAPQATTLREEEVPTEVPEVADTQEQEIAPRDVRDADAVEAFMSTDEVHPPDMKGPEEREMTKKPGEHEMDNVEPDETAPQATTLREEEVPTEVPEVADTQEQEIAPRDVSDADAVEAFMSTDEVHPPDMKGPEEREMSGVEPDDVSTKVTGLHEDGEGAYPAEAKKPGEHEMDNVEPDETAPQATTLREEEVPTEVPEVADTQEQEIAPRDVSDADAVEAFMSTDEVHPPDMKGPEEREMSGVEPDDVSTKVTGLHEDGEGAYPAEAKEPGEHEMDNVEPDETAPQATTLREEEVPTEVPEVADTQEQEIAPRDVSDADAVEAFMSTDEVHPPDMKGPEEREMSGVEPDDVSTKVTGLHEDGEGAYPAEAKEPGEHEMDNVEPDETAPQATTLREEEVPTEVPEVADTKSRRLLPVT